LSTTTTSSTLSSSGGASRAPAAPSAAPYFYHTCPQYQPKDLDKERNEILSPEEREEADNDLHGTGAVLRETPDLVQASLEEFHDALASIPSHEKHSYLMAVEATSKEFVASESPPPLAFLRCEQFDAPKAAMRFVAYWSTRHKIFGDDRAFRCMSKGSNRYRKKSECCGEQLGTEAVEEHVYDDEHEGGGDPDPEDYDNDTGCMSDVDWEALERGTAKELPHDDRGRAVVVFKANCVPMELADTQPILVR
jgi:hypothetical protein